MDWIAHVTAALFSTYRGASKLPDDILAVEGYSSPLVRRLLNNLCDFDGCRYLEVGTWQGATALSASYLNKAFTQFDRVLTDPFIAIVDDWNWKRVRTGTRRAFADLRYDVLAMWNLNSPGNCAVSGWWNGLFLAVISRTNRS
jgi:hypothetical protein